MNDFEVSVKLNGHNFLRIDSERLKESVDFYKKNKSNLYGVSLSNRLFKEENLDFITQIQDVRGIIIVDEIKDISAIQNASNLEYIQMEKLNLALDLSCFPKLKELRCDWSKKIKNLSLSENLETLALWGYKSASNSLGELSLPMNIKNLELVKSSVVSLAGIEKNTHLESVSIHYFNNLEDISSLSQLKRLRQLHLEKCKKISSYDSLIECQSLSTLNIEDCAAINDLSFLNKISNLEEVFFVGTKVQSDYNRSIMNKSLKKIVGTNGAILKL